MTRKRNPDPHNFIARLNELLRFAQLDPWKLTNGDREELKDRLYFVFYNLPRDRGHPLVEFEQAATPEGLGNAARVLNEQVNAKESDFTFHLAAQDLRIFNTPKGDYYYRYTSKDFSTLVFQTFAYLLFMSELRRQDFFQCSHCRTWFIPKRSPHKGEPTFCNKKCANVIAARKFRKSKKNKRLKRRKPK